MKIGILTFHCAHNYGAVLQCWALKETLINMGYDVEVIDYRPKYLTKPYKLFDVNRYIRKNIFKTIKTIYIELINLKKRKNRIYQFENFICNNLNLSTRVIGKDIPNNFDLYIIGSDQVWNPEINGNKIDGTFWGEFKGKVNGKIITYAASMGITDINQNFESYIKKVLNNFNSISVRESQLNDIINGLTSKKIEVVLDPTLLLNTNYWDKITEEPIINDKYVLIYQFCYHKRMSNIAKHISSEIGAKVIEINVDLKKSGDYLTLYDLTPNQFLGYFKKASFIVTASFHGTAFSIIFNKPFYYINFGESSNSRVETLLTKLQLQNRMKNINELPSFKNINYDEVNKEIIELRNSSFSFLNNSIKESY